MILKQLFPCEVRFMGSDLASYPEQESTRQYGDNPKGAPGEIAFSHLDRSFLVVISVVTRTVVLLLQMLALRTATHLA
jgi:hypothetical protein